MRFRTLRRSPSKRCHHMTDVEGSFLFQYGNMTFNKARIMNIAFITAWKEDPSFGCVIFHDVDLIPEDGKQMSLLFFCVSYLNPLSF